MSIGTVLTRVVAVCLLVAVAITASAQPSANLPKRAEMIKRKADSLTSHSPISVIPVHGGEEFGEFLSNDQEGLTFRDIDRKVDVTLKYTEVRKLKNGYGGYNSPRGRHTDRSKAIIITAVVLGGLGALIGAAATAKN